MFPSQRWYLCEDVGVERRLMGKVCSSDFVTSISMILETIFLCFCKLYFLGVVSVRGRWSGEEVDGGA